MSARSAMSRRHYAQSDKFRTHRTDLPCVIKRCIRCRGTPLFPKASNFCEQEVLSQQIEVIRYPLSTKKYLRQPNHLAEVQNGRETPTLPRRREYHRALGCIATIDRLFCCTNAWKVRQKCRRVNDRNTDCILDTMKVVAGTTQLLKTPSHRALRPRSGTRRARRQRTGHTKATSRFGTQGRYCQACLCQKSHGI